MRALLLALLLGCGGRVANTPTTTAATAREAARWCVVLEVERERWVTCAYRQAECNRRQRQAREYGGRFGVRAVSACEWVSK